MRNVITPRFFGQQLRSGHWSTEGLIFYWRGIPAGNIVDESPNGNHGTITGNPTWVGDGLTFTFGDFAMLSNDITFADGEPWTAIFEFQKGPGGTINDGGIVGKTDNSYIWFQQGFIARYHEDGGTNFDFNDFTDWSFRQTVAIRVDAGFISIFQNGVFGSSKVNTASATTWNRIGIADTFRMVGSMYDIKIYNRALLQPEIQELSITPDLPIRQDNITLWAQPVVTGVVPDIFSDRNRNRYESDGRYD